MRSIVSLWLITTELLLGLTGKRLIAAIVKWLLLTALVHPAILPGFKQCEVINDNFGNVHPVTLLVFVVPGLNPAFDPHQGTLMREVTEVFRGLTPDDAVDKVGVPVPVLVPELPVNSQGK